MLNTAADSGLELRANAGQSRYVFGTTGGTNRMLLNIANADAESGSDAGSNFALIAFTDGGGVIDTPLKIFRAAGGHIGFSRPTDIAGNLAVTGNLSFTGSITGLTGYPGGTGTIQYLDWTSTPQSFSYVNGLIV